MKTTPRQSRTQLINKVRKEFPELILFGDGRLGLDESGASYIKLYSDASQIDGLFSASELRLIADAMDYLDELIGDTV